MTDEPPKPKSRRGFASMSPERRIEIARLGGAAHRKEGRAFSVNRDLARAAGRKGGLQSAASRAKPPEGKE